MRGRRKRKERIMRMIQMSMMNGNNNNGAFVRLYNMSDVRDLTRRAIDRLKYSNSYGYRELVPEELPVSVKQYIKGRPIIAACYNPRDSKDSSSKVEVSLDFVDKNVNVGELEQLEDLVIVDV